MAVLGCGGSSPLSDTRRSSPCLGSTPSHGLLVIYEEVRTGGHEWARDGFHWARIGHGPTASTEEGGRVTGGRSAGRGSWRVGTGRPATSVLITTRHVAPSTFVDREYAEGWMSEERKLISQGLWTPPDQRWAEALEAEARENSTPRSPSGSRRSSCAVRDASANHWHPPQSTCTARTPV